MKKIMLAAMAAIVLVPVAAWSAENWSVDKEDQRENRMVLSGMPDQEEVDTDVWLACRKDGRFDIGLGANDSIGEGKGEAVSVTLTSGGKTATVKGTSHNSDNFEMTGGTELIGVVAKSDPLFAVLSAGPTVKTKSGKTTGSFDTKGLQKKLPAFLASCVAKK